MRFVVILSEAKNLYESIIIFHLFLSVNLYHSVIQPKRLPLPAAFCFALLSDTCVPIS